MVTPTPTLTPVSLIITEVFPKPSQDTEWVELYNPNLTEVSLAGWELWDELSQPSLIFSFTTQNLPAGQWLVVPISKKLNDTADGVVLKKPQGDISDAMHYQGSETDLSWSRQGLLATDPWILSESSQGLPNPIPTASPMPTATATPVPTPSSIPSQITAMPTTTPLPSLPKTQINTPSFITETKVLPLLPPPPTSSPSESFVSTADQTAIPPQLSSPVPTLSLRKLPVHQEQQPLTIHICLYFVGISLMHLSSIGISLSKKHGMIGSNVVA